MCDEIQYKLDSKDPVLISHAISKLFDSVRKKIVEQPDTQISKVPEFKLLLSKCNSTEPVLSLSACQALILLVENGLWDAGAALCTFTSSLSNAQNYPALATTIGHLLVIDLKRNKDDHTVHAFTLSVPQHPFIMILNQSSHNWRAVLNEMKHIMTHRDQRVREKSIEMLRPVFLYTLCGPTLDISDGCKQQMWQLLLESRNSSELQLEALLWSCVNNVNACVDTSCRIFELSDRALAEKDNDRCTALLPILVSLTIHVLKHGSDPRPHADRILVLIDRCESNIGNILLALMAELIVLCPATYLQNALEICTAIVDKMPCDVTFVNTLVASLSKWMAYPSALCSEALATARELILKAFRTVNSSKVDAEITNRLFVAFSYADPYIRFYTEALHCLSAWTENNVFIWLNNLSHLPIDLRDKWKLILSGLFLQTSNLDVLNLTCCVLVEISREIKSFGSHVLCLVLHRLTKFRSMAEAKCLLLAVPDLITTKENIPIVTHTLDTLLNGDKQLKYFAIELYLKAVKKEPRCYRFLSSAIIRTMKNDHSWYADATCARAMRHICENYSEHGEKLVPLLSQILNRCVDTTGGTASALALKSISALCRYAVINVCSTWQVLAPKMEKEKRTIVLESLCEFFGDIPLCPVHYSEKENEKLINEVVSILWKYVAADDTRTAIAALRALASYDIDQIPLKSLPAEFRCNLVLPAAYVKTQTDGEKRAEDVLPYVPGTCWIQMLQKVNKTALTSAGNLLISFIERELRTFRSGIYVWPQGEPRNFKYLPEKSVIRAVGEYLRRSDKTDPDSRRVITECLRIFAYRYPKPLPNVNWAFLEQTMPISDEAKEYSLLIGCHHSIVSLSAKSFIENYLSTYEADADSNPILQTNEYLILYSCLDDLCQSISPNHLKPFLVVTLQSVVKKLSFDNENSIPAFDRIMSAYGRALKSKDIHDGNCTVISNILEKLFDKIDLASPRFRPYFVAALELPLKDLERMTSPRVWLEITADRLKNAIAVGAALALKKRGDSPLHCLNESIDVTASVSSVQAYLMEVMQKVHSEMRFEKSVANWILDFMNHIQGLVVEATEENINKVDFYCNILFISIICVSGMDSMLTRKSQLVTKHNVRARLFPQAIAILTDRQDWRYTIPQIMSWLHYMRTSSVSDTHKSAFHASLICLKHHPYYKDVWPKYLSVKTAVNF